MAVYRTTDNKELTLGTSYWVKYIKSRIKSNKNFLGCFIGQTGSGKSYSAISLAELINDGSFNIDNLFFNASDFLKKLASGNLKKGEVLIWDEAGKDLNSKQWQKKTNKVVNIVMQIFRRENVIVLFTLPYLSFLDSDARKLIHATFENVGIDRKNKTTSVKPLLIQVSQYSGKPYTHFLRVEDKEQGLIPIERIKLPIADGETLEQYEQFKEEMAKQTYQDAYNDILKMEKQEKQSQIVEIGGIKYKNLTDIQKMVLELMQEVGNDAEVAKRLGLRRSKVLFHLENAKKRQVSSDFD